MPLLLPLKYSVVASFFCLLVTFLACSGGKPPLESHCPGFKQPVNNRSAKPGFNFFDQSNDLCGCAGEVSEEAWVPVMSDRFPMVASLRRSDKQHGCGGIQVNNRYILTAAHCVQEQEIGPNPIVWVGKQVKLVKRQQESCLKTTNFKINRSGRTVDGLMELAPVLFTCIANDAEILRQCFYEECGQNDTGCCLMLVV